jgi:hypothetical protein
VLVVVEGHLEAWVVALVEYSLLLVLWSSLLIAKGTLGKRYVP